MPATELILAPGTLHVALTRGCIDRCLGQAVGAVALLCVLQPGICIALLLAVVDAIFDGHAIRVHVAGVGEETRAIVLADAALHLVSPNGLDGGGWYAGGEVPDGQAQAAPTDLTGIAFARVVAAIDAVGRIESGCSLEGVAAEAFLEVFEASQGVVVGPCRAEVLAGFDGHTFGVAIVAAHQHTRKSIVGTAHICPWTVRLAGCGIGRPS